MIGTAQAFSVRQTARLALDPDPPSDQRTLARFAEQVALTGVSIREGNRLIFAGWDRKRGRRVRVIVEEIDD